MHFGFGFANHIFRGPCFNAGAHGDASVLQILQGQCAGADFGRGCNWRSGGGCFRLKVPGQTGEAFTGFRILLGLLRLALLLGTQALNVILVVLADLPLQFLQALLGLGSFRLPLQTLGFKDQVRWGPLVVQPQVQLRWLDRCQWLEIDRLDRLELRLACGRGPHFFFGEHLTLRAGGCDHGQLGFCSGLGFGSGLLCGLAFGLGFGSGASVALCDCGSGLPTVDHTAGTTQGAADQSGLVRRFAVFFQGIGGGQV